MGSRIQRRSARAGGSQFLPEDRIVWSDVAQPLDDERLDGTIRSGDDRPVRPGLAFQVCSMQLGG
jgi:hypothetical protein